MKKKILLSALLPLMLLGACGTDDYVAVTGNIEGTVKNAKTNEPVQNCEVISNAFGTKFTDANGHYRFEDVEPGLVSLSYKAPGYASATRDVNVTIGKTVTADVNLDPLASQDALYADKSILDFGNRTGVLNLILTNPTESSIGYTIMANASWISTDPDRGTVLPGRETTIRVSVNRDGLSEGSYDRILTIETANSTIEIQVIVDKGSELRPAVNTVAVTQSNDNPTTIKADGVIAVVGSSNITRHGFCYAIGKDPTLEENDGFTNLGDINYPANFSSLLTNMEFEKEYHIRAYATNVSGTGYGEVKTIILHKVEYANVVTGNTTNVSSSTATLNGSTTGGTVDSFKRFGFFYGTTPDCKNQSTNATGSGSTFTLQLTNLTPDTEYYYKAYGEDSRGMQYGEVKSFRTSKDDSATGTISMITTDASNITETSAVLNGAFSVNGKAKIKEYGFFYGTAPNPSLRLAVASYSSAKSLESTSFNATATKLNPSTTYYFQSYVIDENSKVIRGSEQTFKTKTTPTIVLTSAYSEHSDEGRYYIRHYGTATIDAQGYDVLEAGVILADVDWQIDYSPSYRPSRGSQVMGEIIGNVMSYDYTKYEMGTYYHGYIRAFMVLSNGTVIYSSENPQYVPLNN